jgi:hypothetical protein
MTEKGGRAMIDPAIRQLLEQAIDSPIKLQLLMLFHDNRYLELTAQQVANRIFRDIWSTRDALRELHQDGVLGVKTGSADPCYFYQPRSDHVEHIARLVHSYNEPIERNSVQLALRQIADEAFFRRAQHSSAFEHQMM